jgi:hypothetical protein
VALSPRRVWPVCFRNAFAVLRRMSALDRRQLRMSPWRVLRDSIVEGRAHVPSGRWAATMKKLLLAGVGALIALVGVVWTLQGLGYIGGSGMSGATVWAVIGPVVVVVGLAVTVVSTRGRGSRL